MIVYAVIDTNVIVSAMLSSHDDAATVRVVEKRQRTYPIK
jgi:predicted nucleic acid-binding protein